MEKYIHGKIDMIDRWKDKYVDVMYNWKDRQKE